MDKAGNGEFAFLSGDLVESFLCHAALPDDITLSNKKLCYFPTKRFGRLQEEMCNCVSCEVP